MASVRMLYQFGFTLLELLTVIAVMAVLGGVVMSNYNVSVQVNARSQAAEYEMEQIRQSLLNFKQDNLIYPNQTSAADVGFLFEQGSLSQWNKDYGLGWRGPYMNGGDSGLVDIGDNLQLDGNGSPHQITSVTHRLQRAIPDPFIHAPVNNNSSVSLGNGCNDNSDNNQCLFDWRYVGDIGANNPHSNYGRPYLFFDLNDDSKARIVSMGVNGIYETNPDVNQPCKPSGDDIIKCLY